MLVIFVIVVVFVVAKAHKTCQLNRHCVVIKLSAQVVFAFFLAIPVFFPLCIAYFKAHHSTAAAVVDLFCFSLVPFYALCFT